MIQYIFQNSTLPFSAISYFRNTIGYIRKSFSICRKNGNIASMIQPERFVQLNYFPHAYFDFKCVIGVAHLNYSSLKIFLLNVIDDNEIWKCGFSCHVLKIVFCFDVTIRCTTYLTITNWILVSTVAYCTD